MWRRCRRCYYTIDRRPSRLVRCVNAATAAPCAQCVMHDDTKNTHTHAQRTHRSPPTYIQIHASSLGQRTYSSVLHLVSAQRFSCHMSVQRTYDCLCTIFMCIMRVCDVSLRVCVMSNMGVCEAFAHSHLRIYTCVLRRWRCVRAASSAHSARLASAPVIKSSSCPQTRRRWR